LIEAARRIAARCASGALRTEEIDEASFSGRAATGGRPDPDLFVRTGGEHAHQQLPAVEHRVRRAALHRVDSGPISTSRISMRRSPIFAGRERRFGRTGAQTRQGGA
jgi:undecaprenyl diphosphate synthase